MSDKTAPNPFYLRAENYWVQSRRPIVSLVFIAPFMVIYEAGVVFLGIQNGADAWMRQFLDMLGFSQHLLLPLLTVCMLLAWQYLIREPWRFPLHILSPMAVECIFLAICLRVVLTVQGTLLFAVGDLAQLSIGSKFKLGVGYLGAGIYEELLFRLLMLTAIAWIIRRWWTTPKAGMVLAVLVSSLIFSAAHYIGHAGDTFSWFTFLFRFVAGVFFSILFIYRGFGIAAGAHAAYDILVGLF